MPAKRKVTREAIIKAAFRLLRNGGEEAVNARGIARELKCSTQPIYSEFQNMEELKTELKKEAEKRYTETVKEYMRDGRCARYKAYGLGYIRFAREEKQLFRYLYLRDREEGARMIEDVNAPEIGQTLRENYGMTEETAEKLHFDMAVYSYGLAVTVNSGYLHMTDEEISECLDREFYALAYVYGIKL